VPPRARANPKWREPGLLPPLRRLGELDSRSQAQGGNDRRLQSFRKDFVLEIELESFLPIREGLLGRLTLTGDLNVETTCDVLGILVSDRYREVHGLIVPDRSRTVPIRIANIQVTDPGGGERTRTVGGLYIANSDWAVSLTWVFGGMRSWMALFGRPLVTVIDPQFPLNRARIAHETDREDGISSRSRRGPCSAT
jgi:hypothetical protein